MPADGRGSHRVKRAPATSRSSRIGAAQRRPSGERKRELLTFWLYRGGERVIGALPRGLSMPAAAAVGNVAYDLAGPKQRLIRENLSRPMRLPADHRARAARGAPRLPQLREVPRRHDAHRRAQRGGGARGLVSIENIEILHRGARARARASCCAPPTSAAWTSSAPALKALGEALYVVADDTTYGRLYDHLAEARARQRHLRHRLAQPARHVQGAARRTRTSSSSATAATGAATSRWSCAARRPRCRSVRPRWPPRPARRC